MTPAQPPLPTASYFWFQSADGSHTSILISESLVGLRVAETRQNAGRSLYTLFAPGPRPARPFGFPGRVNAPAATFCALVIVASGRLRDARLSQDVAAVAGTLASASASRVFKAQLIVDAPSG